MAVNHRLSTRLLVLVAAAVSCWTATSTAAPQSDLDSLLGKLREVSAEVQPARDAWKQAQADRNAAQIAFVQAQAQVDTAHAVAKTTSAASGQAALALAQAETRVASVAVSAYVGGGVGESGVEALIGSSDPALVVRKKTLIGVVGEQRSEAVDGLERAKGRADEKTLAAANSYSTALDEREAAWMMLSDATTAEAQARDAIVAALAAVDSVRREIRDVAPMVSAEKVDIPLVVLDAYQKAASWAQTELGCDLQWWGIAGTGKNETNHARYLGRHALANGDVVPPIRGIPLDGTRSAAISDTDNGVLDGDAVWDRAVGPNQFIPATWRWYAKTYDVDGNGDGVKDPDNIYDASRATAAMHCRNGAGTTDSSLRRAYLAYNRVPAYVERCLRSAHEYRDAGIVNLSALALPAEHGDVPAPPPPMPEFPVRQDVGLSPSGRRPAAVASTQAPPKVRTVPAWYSDAE